MKYYGRDEKENVSVPGNVHEKKWECFKAREKKQGSLFSIYGSG